MNNSLVTVSHVCADHRNLVKTDIRLRVLVDYSSFNGYISEKFRRIFLNVLLTAFILRIGGNCIWHKKYIIWNNCGSSAKKLPVLGRHFKQDVNEIGSDEYQHCHVSSIIDPPENVNSCFCCCAVNKHIKRGKVYWACIWSFCCGIFKSAKIFLHIFMSC